MTPLEIKLRDHLRQVADRIEPRMKTAPGPDVTGPEAAKQAQPLEGSCAMTMIPEITIRPLAAQRGDVITRDPHVPFRHGEWTITDIRYDGFLTCVDWRHGDHEAGVFKLTPTEWLTVRGRRTGAAA